MSLDEEFDRLTDFTPAIPNRQAVLELMASRMVSEIMRQQGVTIEGGRGLSIYVRGEIDLIALAAASLKSERKP